MAAETAHGSAQSASVDSGIGRFVLQMEDPITGSVAAECLLRIRDLAALKEILKVEADDTHFAHTIYPLADGMLDAIGALSDPPFSPDPIFTHIAPWNGSRGLPYLLHTGFELPLMLDGRKPFAKFSDVYPLPWLDALLARFEPHVRQGRIVGRIIDEPFASPVLSRVGPLLGQRRAYFALPGEEWRIDAHWLLEAVGARSGWTKSLTRYEGSLLGYEDWQNDWWIAHRFTPGIRAEPD